MRSRRIDVFFEVIQWVHGFFLSFLLVLLFAFHCDKTKKGDQSAHLN